MNEQERAALMGVESVLRGQPPAPAEHVATLVAHSPGKVSSMTCTCGVSIVGDVLPFAGVTRLMLEHLNGGKSDTVLRDVASQHGYAYVRPSVSPLGFPDR